MKRSLLFISVLMLISLCFTGCTTGIPAELSEATIPSEYKDVAVDEAKPTFDTVSELKESLSRGFCEVYGVTYSLNSVRNQLSEFCILSGELPGYRLHRIVLYDTVLQYYYIQENTGDSITYDNCIIVSCQFSLNDCADILSILEAQTGVQRNSEGYLYRPNKNEIAFAVGDSCMTIYVPDSMNSYEILKELASAVKVASGYITQ